MVLSADISLQSWVREVHPEVCFWAWNKQLAMEHKKKSASGKTERRRLIDEYFGNDAVPNVRMQYLAREVSDDDINDALAAVWTAERILVGSAGVLPDQPPVDSVGLRMEMWY
jgi:predicted RNase H-like nuclease